MNQHDVDQRALDLLRAADRLAAHNFEEWSAFIRAFGMYSEIPMMQLLLTSNADHTIHHVQGRARMAHDLADMMVQHRKYLAELENKLAAQRRTQPARKGTA